LRAGETLIRRPLITRIKNTVLVCEIELMAHLDHDDDRLLISCPDQVDRYFRFSMALNLLYPDLFKKVPGGIPPTLNISEFVYVRSTRSSKPFEVN